MVEISIVIPVYNAAKTIKKCVASVLESSFKNVEIILVNDGSKDNSEEIILSNFKDDRIKYISQPNGGQSSARNRGLQEATGKYVMLMDSDDYFSFDYLESMYNLAETSGAEVVISGFTRVDSNYQTTKVFKYTNDKNSQYSMLMPWGKLVKKSLIDKYDIKFENVNYWEDHLYSFTIYTYANKVVTDVNNVGYYYYCNVNGLTNTKFLAFKVDLLPTHELILKKINPIDLKNNEEFWKYIFLKSTISHMLESGRNAKKELFMQKDKLVFEWYENNISKLKNIKIPKDEKFSIKITIRIYLILRKSHLLKLFAKIYCKGDM